MWIVKKAHDQQKWMIIFLNAVQNAFFYFSKPFLDFIVEKPKIEIFTSEKPKIAFFKLSAVKKAFFDFTAEKPKIAVFYRGHT